MTYGGVGNEVAALNALGNQLHIGWEGLSNSSQSNEYYTIYNNEDWPVNTDVYQIGRTGDATKELVSGRHYTWGNYMCNFAGGTDSSSSTWHVRAGRNMDGDGGQFYLAAWAEPDSWTTGWRVILAP